MLHCNQNCFQIQSHYTLYILCTQRNPIDALCTRLVRSSQLCYFVYPALTSSAPPLMLSGSAPRCFLKFSKIFFTILLMFPIILVLSSNLNIIAENVLLYKCSIRLLSMDTLNRAFMQQIFYTYFNNLNVLLIVLLHTIYIRSHYASMHNYAHLL